MNKVIRGIGEALWFIMGCCYYPIYFTGHILSMVARIQLAFAWLLMLDKYRALNTFKSIFRWRDL